MNNIYVRIYVLYVYKYIYIYIYIYIVFTCYIFIYFPAASRNSHPIVNMFQINDKEARTS